MTYSPDAYPGTTLVKDWHAAYRNQTVDWHGTIDGRDCVLWCYEHGYWYFVVGDGVHTMTPLANVTPFMKMQRFWPEQEPLASLSREQRREQFLHDGIAAYRSMHPLETPAVPSSLPFPEGFRLRDDATSFMADHEVYAYLDDVPCHLHFGGNRVYFGVGAQAHRTEGWWARCDKNVLRDLLYRGYNGLNHPRHGVDMNARERNRLHVLDELVRSLRSLPVPA